MRTKQEYLIRYKDGNLYCELADIWIDPSKPVKNAIITHAHFDHFTFGCEEYISTKETAILLKERVGDNIRIDFNSACIQVIEKKEKYITANVINEGNVGSNKAVDIDRDISLDPITPKYKAAIKIGKKMGIKHHALSFAGSQNNVKMFREYKIKKSD